MLVGGKLRVMQLTFITPDESCTGIGLVKDPVSLALEWPWTGLLDERYLLFKAHHHFTEWKVYFSIVA